MLSLKGTHVDGERFEYVPTLPPPLLLEGIRENSGTAHAETSAVKSYHIPHITIKPSCRTSNKKLNAHYACPQLFNHSLMVWNHSQKVSNHAFNRFTITQHRMPNKSPNERHNS